MAKITVNMGNFKVDELELEPGTLSIGRNHDNRLHINDPMVSKHHAQIVTVFNSTYVEDLGSTNGTLVNGQKAKTHTLHNGDVLTIGHYQILFQSETPVPLQNINVTLMTGVSQLEKLTQKAKQKKGIHSKKTPQKVDHTSPQQLIQQPSAHSTQTTDQPALKLHENTHAPVTENTTLPDIGDCADFLGHKQRPTPIATMRPLRKSDTSPIPSLKTIVLAVLAAVATFNLLMILFN